MKILTHKYCPVCQTKVEWKRFVYKTWGFSKWDCPTCNTKLTFNLTRRLFGAVIFLIIGFILVEVAIAYKLPSVVYFLIAALCWIAFVLNDGVIVHKTFTKLSKKPLYIALLISLIMVLTIYIIMLKLGHVGEVAKALLYAYLIFFVVLAIFLLLGRYQKD